MRRLAAYHAAQRDDAGEAPGLGKGHRSERKFERYGNLGDGHRLSGNTCELELVECALERQGLGLGLGLSLGLGALLFARGTVGLELRLLCPGIILIGCGDALLAGPVLLRHASRSDSSKRRSWWCSLCASLSRLATR